MRILVTAICLSIFFSAIGCLFYFQQLQYLLPTPVPKGYQVILAGEVVSPTLTLPKQTNLKPTFFHFFNPHCPCSKFNLKHFQVLKNQYHQQVTFYAVVTSTEKARLAKKLLGENISILVDDQQKLAKACGVYATPQAAIIEKDNKLYYRGNYNRARYCTDPKSNYAWMAIDSLLSGKAPPAFDRLATTSYGCSNVQQQD